MYAKLSRAFSGVCVALVAMLPFGAGPARAAGPMPAFQLPFPCGETWRLATYSGHDDYDIDMTWTGGGSNGRAILASAAGTVAFAGWGSGGGNYVIIDHGGGWRSTYMHMIEAPMVGSGQSVARGQQIGRVGSTGNSTGPHLHYEVTRDGGKTEAYFNGSPSGITSDGSASTGPIYVNGPVSPARNVTSNNCGGGSARHDHVSDFSGDGAADVLGVDSAGALWYYPNNGQALSARVQIGNGWGTFKHVMAADWSGDGAADVLGVDATGKLWYYPHDGAGLSTPVQIGNGWGTFKHVMAADYSGDGKADVLGVDASGLLWYYPHNGSGLSAPVQIGNGWGTFLQVTAADYSGDGAADVLGVDATGKLWYYPHNGAGLSTPVQIGNGWATFLHVNAVDFSGDGAADVLGVDSAGKLWYYPHNGAGLSAPVQIGNGWATFKHVI
ncbi:peptidoglycan DD-metalloendopeptidase family protein [Catellatospora vulcania]|uniref:peptidoglycan DD-metalloendopeptidase family protein n=1 Tax=Catellatospora vulcania TaxID=1460450 RepID=UPI0012D43748|nr:peptidoglycan DD-metalloendopeptidase family protein [Catellatospora vulcania]